MPDGRSELFKTPECRFSYIQNAFKPKQKTNDDGSPKLNRDGTPAMAYEVTLIFDRSVDMTPFHNAIREAIVSKWGDKGLEWAKADMIRNPILAGDGKFARSQKTGEINPGLGPDKFFIRCSSQMPPSIVYRHPNIPATPAEVKSGDYGWAVINAFAWENDKGGKGVSFGFAAIQKLRDGEPLGGSGGIKTEDWFEQIPDAGPAPAATASRGAAGMFG